MYVICVWSEFCVFMNNRYSVYACLYISKFYPIELVTSREGNNHQNFALNPTVSYAAVFLFYCHHQN